MRNQQIGFIQGRLSPIVDGKIQAFPWANWQAEFVEAESLGFKMMEWTIDHDRFQSNPFVQVDSRRIVSELKLKHGVRIPSVTCDFLMQAPIWKSYGAARTSLFNNLLSVVESAGCLEVALLVIPLVDNGSVESAAQENDILSIFGDIQFSLERSNIKIAFESDYDPAKLNKFIDRFDPLYFGINYDIGNSAALGFNAKSEIEVYGPRILNVHVKDRKFGGGTVPLGTGSADFDSVFRALADTGYKGNFILQTARAENEMHGVVLGKYGDQVDAWIKKYGL